AVFNFFFFSTTKDKQHLYFALFTLVYGIVPYLSDLLAFLLRETPHLDNDIELAMWFLSTVFLVNFFRHYFETYKYHRAWDKILLTSLYFYLIASVVFLLLQKPTTHFWRFIVGDAPGFMLQLSPMLLFIVSLVYLTQKKAVRSRVIPILPALF